MGDITNPRLLYLKGVLFLVLGALASATILMLHPEIRVAILLAIATWAFCRAYYFAFYVVQHYVDPSYRFAGLISFARHLIKNRRDRNTTSIDQPRS